MITRFRHPLSWLNFFASFNPLKGWFQAYSITSTDRTGSFSYACFPSSLHRAMDSGNTKDDDDDFPVDDEDDEDETDYENDDDLFLDDDEDDDRDLDEKDDQHDDDDVD